ncbi:hypothetical protein ABKV19_008703 [Rosa sericea]
MDNCTEDVVRYSILYILKEIAYLLKVQSHGSKTTGNNLCLLDLQSMRSGECACTAYVTFKDPYSHETACLLSSINFTKSAATSNAKFEIYKEKRKVCKKQLKMLPREMTRVLESFCRSRI